MENMIKKIIEMDEKARKLTEEAKEAKLNSSSSIAKKRVELRESYLSRARARIEINRQTEQKLSDEQWLEIQKKYAQLNKNLDEQFNEKSADWVNEIFSRVVGGK